ncbi:MAG: hypothetical protein IJ737_00740 [Ruminococcus sp.]|nr:hypothetical protein [Ruminococcus sp.]
MSGLQEYKCPCCDGAIRFDTAVQKMKCPYCDTEFEMETLLQYDQDLNTDDPVPLTWEKSENEWDEGETEGMRIYHCESCGGEIIGDDSIAATKCPYCDNPVVMMGQFKGDLKPDYIIPFKLDKKAATEGLKGHLLNKRFLPPVFKDKNHIDEVKGVYVPFWLFDTNGSGGARYKATTVRSWSTGSYRYTETNYFSVYREGTIDFEKVAIDGSSKMPDDLMESVEPFDSKDILPFQTAYLAGYMADRYDVNSDTSVKRANERVRNSIDDVFAKTVTGYATVTPEGNNIRLKNAKAKYALYPVWVMHTSWNGENFLFAMNGQTGKFVGNLPCDKSLYWKDFAKFGIIAAAILYAIVWAWIRFFLT